MASKLGEQRVRERGVHMREVAAAWTVAFWCGSHPCLVSSPASYMSVFRGKFLNSWIALFFNGGSIYL